MKINSRAGHGRVRQVRAALNSFLCLGNSAFARRGFSSLVARDHLGRELNAHTRRILISSRVVAGASKQKKLLLVIRVTYFARSLARSYSVTL